MAKGRAPTMSAYNTPGQQEQCKCAASGVGQSPTPPGQPVGWQPGGQQIYSQGMPAQVAQEGPGMMAGAPLATLSPAWQREIANPSTINPGAQTIARNYFSGGLLGPQMQPFDVGSYQRDPRLLGGLLGGIR